MPIEKEPLVWAQLNDHEINEEDEDTYVFKRYNDRWDEEEWFMSFRLTLIWE